VLEHPKLDVAVEIRDSPEVIRKGLSRVDDADFQSEFAPHQADRLGKIGIVADNDGKVILLLKRIHQEVAGEIDVGAFFLPLDDMHHSKRDERCGLWRIRHGQRPLLLVCRKSPEMDAEVGDRSEGAKVGELTGTVIRIAWVRVNEGGEVSDAVDGSSWTEVLTKQIEIEPAVLTPVGTVAAIVKAAVIEIEPVDVNVRPFRQGAVPIHMSQQTRRDDPEAAPAPSRRSNWGRVISLPRSIIALKTPYRLNRFAKAGRLHGGRLDGGVRESKARYTRP
jgi:hypothetical protein